MIRASLSAHMKSIVMASTLAAALFVAQPVSADGPVVVAPGAVAYRLNNMKVAILRDARFIMPNDGKVFGVDAGPEAVAKVLAQHGAPTDKITLNVNALLVWADAHVVLLDTGLGPKANGALMGSLGLFGVKPAAVTDVLITHSHFDHVGGLLNADGGLAFPNAVIHMSSKEWAAMQADARAKDMVAVITPKVKTFEPGEKVVPHIVAVAIDGHTPGHMGYEISSGGQKMLDIGDAAHSSIVSLAEPDWYMGFDGDKPLAQASRRALLERLAKSGEMVFAPHFPYPSIGRVRANGRTFEWEPTMGAPE